MDDITLGGSADVVNKDVSDILSCGTTVGLDLNRSKCEIISGSTIPSGLLISGFSQLHPMESTLLGAPLLGGVALDETLLDCCSSLQQP